VVLVAVAAALSGCGGDKQDQQPQQAGLGGTSTPAARSLATAEVSALEATQIGVVDRVSPTVVQIKSGSGLGSGVVYDDNGNIVTNNHVVEGSRKFEVTLADNRTHPATLVGTFPPEDLAVIRLEDTKPPPATLGDSSKLQVGQFALAIGNPLGLRSSVTQGIISSLGRTVSEGGGAVVSSAIQTSAPINPGNSGGALVDLQGQVVGIPTLAALDPQLGGTQAAGIGFAIPSNTVRRIADQIVKDGKVTNSGRAYLGVRVASGVGGSGVLVTGVARNGPADDASIRAGDVITAVDHHATPSTDALAAILAQLKPGQRVPVEVISQNGGQKRTVQVTLGTLPPT
jgi:S1-C subfamily serine protease